MAQIDTSLITGATSKPLIDYGQLQQAYNLGDLIHQSRLASQQREKDAQLDNVFKQAQFSTEGDLLNEGQFLGDLVKQGGEKGYERYMQFKQMQENKRALDFKIKAAQEKQVTSTLDADKKRAEIEQLRAETREIVAKVDSKELSVINDSVKKEGKDSKAILISENPEEALNRQIKAWLESGEQSHKEISDDFNFDPNTNSFIYDGKAKNVLEQNVNKTREVEDIIKLEKAKKDKRKGITEKQRSFLNRIDPMFEDKLGKTRIGTDRELAEDDVKILKKQSSFAPVTITSANKVKSFIENNSLVDLKNMFSSKSSELSSLVASMLLNEKDLRDLGALQESEIKLLNRQFSDPTKWDFTNATKGQMLAKVKAYKDATLDFFNSRVHAIGGFKKFSESDVLRLGGFNGKSSSSSQAKKTAVEIKSDEGKSILGDLTGG